MRYYPLLIVGLVAFYSCNSTSKPQSQFENIPSTDSTCLKEVRNAKADIRKGKLTFCHFVGMLVKKSSRSDQEMDSLLTLFGINHQAELVSDVVMEGQTDGCYCGFMREQIDQKFGKTFIDSLLTVSDSLYVQNHIHDTMYYASCDTRPNYPSDTTSYEDEFSERFQNDLDQRLIYPVGYSKRANNDSPAFVDVYLYVEKSGNASITGYRFVFDMKTNHKYETYFKSKIEEAIRIKGWTPATIRKQKVNSDMVMRLFFD
ncbi:hypothetical protein [Xanthocytophaga agilis]|uniref:Lipoprotein n=1 Tax=Xanthocytophaga agilis TaxID=3048010 RepID=A0AAE3RA46_9BACT|nr:hypothetical protein [Xanthocytophaga agilis]MDJ1506015.1 hypothetical protein [Xanthocytophaga agilis]